MVTPNGGRRKIPRLYYTSDNVGSTELLFVNQCVGNSPSKIRGGWGALMLRKALLEGVDAPRVKCFEGESYSSGATRHLP